MKHKGYPVKCSECGWRGRRVSGCLRCHVVMDCPKGCPLRLGNCPHCGNEVMEV